MWLGPGWYTAVGVLGPMPLAPEIERSVLVGWTAAQTGLGFDGHPTAIYLRASESAMDDVRKVLARTINPGRPSSVDIGRPSEALTAKRITQNAFSGLLFGLAAIALVVGGIGVANTMIISVLERRTEIGLRRALGANRGQIRLQFLTESVVLCLLGGIFGAALGSAATAAYATLKGWPTVLPMTAITGGLAGALLIGVLAGVHPAVRAARLTPTEALAAA